MVPPGNLATSSLVVRASAETHPFAGMGSVSRSPTRFTALSGWHMKTLSPVGERLGLPPPATQGQIFSILDMGSPA